jgi:hypothetical protein
MNYNQRFRHLALRHLTRGLLVVAACLAMAACGAPPEGTPIFMTAQAPSAPGKGTLVVGVQLVAPPTTRLGLRPSVGYALLRAEPSGGGRMLRQRPSVRWLGMCGLFDHTICGNIQYQAYSVPPGTYALGWVEVGEDNEIFVAAAFRRARLFRSGAITSLSFSGLRIGRQTPVVKVAAGEVVYPGNLVLDFHTPNRLAVSIVQHPAAAREALAPTGLAAAMLVRPWQRPVGPGPHQVVQLFGPDE